MGLALADHFSEAADLDDDVIDDDGFKEPAPTAGEERRGKHTYTHTFKYINGRHTKK